MQAIIKGRWLIVLLWAAVIAVLISTAPNMGTLVREKGQITIPDGYSSSIASDIQARHRSLENKHTLSLVLVFHHAGGLTDKDFAEIGKAADALNQQKDALGIENVTTAIGNKDLERQLVAKDKTTTLALIDVRTEDRKITEIRSDLNAALKDVPVEHYFTGSNLIDEDLVLSSQEGLKRTEIITVVFILAVLVLVFRSLVAPIIPLLTVGIVYITSQSIVAFLVDRFNFPLSTFTQIFLVAVLFGIGTDYCILLLSRFKEEMARGGDVKEAIIKTYSTAGKTVFFSALAALVGFTTIGFATFKLYQSGAAVAVGVAVLIVGLFTIVPFFMAVFGRRLFWPSKGALEHKESKMWEATGRFSLRRPFAAVLIVAIFAVPLLVAYKGNLSFNSLNEIGNKYESVKGFNLIADSFGPGEAMPSKIVIESSKPLDNQEAYAAIEKVSREVQKTPGVAKVRSLTRPLGDPMAQLTVPEQMKTLSDGLGQGTEGLSTISDGLSKARDELSASEPKLQQAVDGISDLVTGTNQLKNGVLELQSGLTRIETGIKSGASGAGDLRTGLTQIQVNAAKLADSSRRLLAGYQKAADGLNQLAAQYAQLDQSLASSAAALNGLDARFNALSSKYPDLASDPDFQILKGTVQKTGQGLSQMELGFKLLNGQLNKAAAGVAQANQGLAEAAGGQEAVANALAKIEAGAASLESGLTAAANGQHQAVSNLPSMSQGLDQLAGGQTELQSGFQTMTGQLKDLTGGLDQSVAGLGKVTDGINSARGYLNQLAATNDKETAGWFMPKEVLDNPQFEQVMKTYLSKDRMVTTLDVVLQNNPYSSEALDTIPLIQAAAERAVKGTPLENATIGVGGVTGIHSDLRNISQSDYKRTVLYMLLGIALILILLLRSLVMPLYLLASLLLSYFMSLSVNELVFVHIFGLEGTSWTIPFFGFVMLMALGVDYSIFLMDRFNEHKDEPVKSAILTAMKNMGTVIVSAVIILAGTFAAMYPSGVMSLLQIATVVLSGLFIYALLFLQFFVPVMVRLFGRGNWWPFSVPRDVRETDYE